MNILCKPIYLLWLVFAVPLGAYAQVYNFTSSGNTDQTEKLQSAFNNPEFGTIVINSKTVLINGTISIPSGKVIRIENGCKISGKGTINGGTLQASYQSNIFDSGITINPKAVDHYFSARWMGATGNGNIDDYAAIQRAINTCIKNNIRTLYIPAGRYKTSQPLILTAIPTENHFCTLELLGESSFWDSNMGSEILPDFNNTFALGIQLGKGCKVRKLTFRGQFHPPHFSNTKDFFNCSFDNFSDKISRDNRNSPYAAIVIDPFSHGNEQSIPEANRYPGLSSSYGSKLPSGEIRGGSTGTEIEEINISGFVVGICSSPNGITQNAEITLINKVQFANCKLCISGGQAQEKANTISNIYCWGGTHTMFATALYGNNREAGNWNIDHVNIAGGVVRFIYNDQHGYFPSYISHVFAETLGTWGTFNSELAASVSDCTIDFAYPNEAGERTLITSWGKNVVYRSCNFRFYGENTPLPIIGDATYLNCYFSGPISKNSVTAFVVSPNLTGGLQVRILVMIFFIFLTAIALYFLIRRKLSFKKNILKLI